MISSSPCVALDEFAFSLVKGENSEWRQRNARNHPSPGIFSVKGVRLCFTVPNSTDSWTSIFLWGDIFRESVSLKLVLRLLYGMAEVPHNILSLDTVFFRCPHFCLYPLQFLLKLPLNLQSNSNIFNFLFLLLSPPRFNPIHVDESKKIWRYHQAHFWQNQ